MTFKVAKYSSQLTILLAALSLATGPALAENPGPQIDVAPDDAATPAPAPVDGAAPALDPLTRGLQAERFARAVKTSIGGYAELHLNHTRPHGGDADTTVDMHRLVIFIAHNMTDRIRWYSEVEVEHTLVGDGKPGEVGVEQAYVEWDLLDDKMLSLRTGIVLVPMGIVNQWHEPPIFNGVERPRVDSVIVPSTWREAAVGVAGQPVEGLRYEAYLMSGLNPLGFSAGSGLRGGRQKVAEARTDGLAFAARVEYEPMLSTVVGASAYAGFAGPNADLFDGAMQPVDITLPILGGGLDARTRWNGIEARGQFVSWQLGDTGDLRAAFDGDGNPAPDIGSTILGGYAELGYNVLHTTGLEQALVPFFRFERYDTLFKVVDRPRNAATDDPRGATDLVLGVSYRPITSVVFKGDATLRNPDGGDNHAWLLNAGVGLMF